MALSALWKAITEHKRSFILKSKLQRQKERGEGKREICHYTRMSSRCERCTLLAKTQWYLCVPAHSTMYICVCVCMCICTCMVSMYNHHIRAISQSNSGCVTALKRCSVRTVPHCHQWELGGTEAGYRQKKVPKVVPILGCHIYPIM